MNYTDFIETREQRIVWAYNPKFHYSFFTYPSQIKTLKDIDSIPEMKERLYTKEEVEYFCLKAMKDIYKSINAHIGDTSIPLMDEATWIKENLK